MASGASFSAHAVHSALVAAEEDSASEGSGAIGSFSDSDGQDPETGDPSGSNADGDLS